MSGITSSPTSVFPNICLNAKEIQSLKDAYLKLHKSETTTDQQKIDNLMKKLSSGELDKNSAIAMIENAQKYTTSELPPSSVNLPTPQKKSPDVQIDVSGVDLSNLAANGEIPKAKVSVNLGDPAFVDKLKKMDPNLQNIKFDSASKEYKITYNAGGLNAEIALGVKEGKMYIKTNESFLGNIGMNTASLLTSGKSEQHQMIESFKKTLSNIGIDAKAIAETRQITVGRGAKVTEKTGNIFLNPSKINVPVDGQNQATINAGQTQFSISDKGLEMNITGSKVESVDKPKPVPQETIKNPEFSPMGDFMGYTDTGIPKPPPEPTKGSVSQKIDIGIHADSKTSMKSSEDITKFIDNVRSKIDSAPPDLKQKIQDNLKESLKGKVSDDVIAKILDPKTPATQLINDLKNVDVNINADFSLTVKTGGTENTEATLNGVKSAATITAGTSTGSMATVSGNVETVNNPDGTKKVAANAEAKIEIKSNDDIKKLINLVNNQIKSGVDPNKIKENTGLSDDLIRQIVAPNASSNESFVNSLQKLDLKVNAGFFAQLDNSNAITQSNTNLGAAVVATDDKGNQTKLDAAANASGDKAKGYDVLGTATTTASNGQQITVSGGANQVKVAPNGEITAKDPVINIHGKNIKLTKESVKTISEQYHKLEKSVKEQIQTLGLTEQQFNSLVNSINLAKKQLGAAGNQAGNLAKQLNVPEKQIKDVMNLLGNETFKKNLSDLTDYSKTLDSAIKNIPTLDLSIKADLLKLTSSNQLTLDNNSFALDAATQSGSTLHLDGNAPKTTTINPTTNDFSATGATLNANLTSNGKKIEAHVTNADIDIKGGVVQTGTADVTAEATRNNGKEKVNVTATGVNYNAVKDVNENNLKALTEHLKKHPKETTELLKKLGLSKYTDDLNASKYDEIIKNTSQNAKYANAFKKAFNQLNIVGISASDVTGSGNIGGIRVDNATIKNVSTGASGLRTGAASVKGRVDLTNGTAKAKLDIEGGFSSSRTTNDGTASANDLALKAKGSIGSSTIGATGTAQYTAKKFTLGNDGSLKVANGEVQGAGKLKATYQDIVNASKDTEWGKKVLSLLEKNNIDIKNQNLTFDLSSIKYKDGKLSGSIKLNNFDAGLAKANITLTAGDDYKLSVDLKPKPAELRAYLAKNYPNIQLQSVDDNKLSLAFNAALNTVNGKANTTFENGKINLNIDEATFLKFIPIRPIASFAASNLLPIENTRNGNTISIPVDSMIANASGNKAQLSNLSMRGGAIHLDLSYKP